MLVIEDNDEHRRRLTDELRRRGWNVIGTRDLRSALDAAIAHQPHVIVSELILPDVRGYQFASALRGAVDHEIRLVAITRLSEELFEHAKRAGFDVVLAKPIDPDALEQQLAS